MTTITTTNLSWSATWSHTPATSDLLDYTNSKKAVVSNTSEESSVLNDNGEDKIVLSKEAQNYTNTSSNIISDSTGTIQKIYNALGKIISSTTTSDAEKWNAFAVADEMRDEYMDNHGIYGLDLSFDQETENSPFMQKINAAYADLNNPEFHFNNEYTGSNPIATKILDLWQKEGTISGVVGWTGSSTLAINIQETTIQTDSGTITRFQLSSNLTGHSDLIERLDKTPNGRALNSENTPVSSSMGLGIQNLSFSGGIKDLEAEFNKEIVEELFSSSDKKTIKTQTDTQKNTSEPTSSSNTLSSATSQNPISGPLS